MLIDRAQNLFEHPVRVSYNVVIPESKHEITHRLEDSRSVRITFALLAVLTAIELDDQFGIRAEEIDDKAVDLHLPLELPSIQATIAESKPQQSFCIGLIAAQSPGESGFRCHHPTPLTPTLSPPGRGSTPSALLYAWFGRSPSR